MFPRSLQHQESWSEALEHLPGEGEANKNISISRVLNVNIEESNAYQRGAGIDNGSPTTK